MSSKLPNKKSRMLIVGGILLSILAAGSIYTLSKQSSMELTGPKPTTQSPVGYSFELPDGWQSSLSNRYSNDPSKGQYGDLEPPAENQAGQIMFQSAKNPGYTLDNYKSSLPGSEDFKGANIEGILGYETKIDPNINSLEVIFVTETDLYRFVYQAKKEYTDYKTLPYVEEFLAIAKSFKAPE